jgi:TRAP-type C4-dicarboxylate transport system permease small subunit
MAKFRVIALILLLAGAALLVYGGWEYFDSRSEVRIGDARLVIEKAKISPAIWVGGSLVIAALLIGGGTMLPRKSIS